LFGALAAGLAIAAFWSAGVFPRPNAAPTYRVIPSHAQQLTLADGTVVELNANSAVEPAFTAHERRVRLIRGEAHFAVVKDSARPFVVEARSIAVRAVGTAFNVRLDSAAVQLLVTEGKVRVENVAPLVTASDALVDSLAAPMAPANVAATPFVTAGERLVVDSTPAAPDLSRARVEAVLPEELERSLAWKRPQLVFDRTPLPEAVAAFNRFNRHQLTIGDGALAKRRLGGAFQADNVDGFIHVLESGFDVIAERRGADETVLRQSR
jgi:transmembrane sensor